MTEKRAQLVRRGDGYVRVVTEDNVASLPRNRDLAHFNTALRVIKRQRTIERGLLAGLGFVAILSVLSAYINSGAAQRDHDARAEIARTSD